MKTPVHAILSCAVLAACATEGQDLVQNASFDTSAGEVEITVDGDGFVRTADRRVPLEAIVLELRQRTRAIPKDELEQRFVVHLLIAPQAAGSEGAARARQGADRLFKELQVMGVRQIRYL